MAELGIGSLLTPDIVLVAACGWCGDILRPSTLLTHAWSCRARGGVARDGNNSTPLASTAAQAALCIQNSSLLYWVVSSVADIRIRVFLGLLDSDPLVKGMDPRIQIRIRTKKSWIRNTYCKKKVK